MDWVILQKVIKYSFGNHELKAGFSPPGIMFNNSFEFNVFLLSTLTASEEHLYLFLPTFKVLSVTPLSMKM